MAPWRERAEKAEALLRELVERHDGYECTVCERTHTHAADCPWLQARSLLGMETQ